MGFEEETVCPGGGGGVQQRRDEAPWPPLEPSAPCPVLLHRMRRIEDHGRGARGAQAA